MVFKWMDNSERACVWFTIQMVTFNLPLGETRTVLNDNDSHEQMQVDSSTTVWWSLWKGKYMFEYNMIQYWVFEPS